MGSQLVDRATDEIVWIDFSKIPWNPLEWSAWLDALFEKMQFGSDQLAPGDVVQDVLFLPPLFKQEQYSRLLHTLASWGYVVNPTEDVPGQLVAHTFTYDWRQNNRISGELLGDQIAKWRALHPNRQVWLMGHSNGGIISRWYIEKEGGKEHVSRLILLASPWDGAVKGLYALLNGFDMFLRWGFDPAHIGARTRAVLRKFPGIYQLLPQARPFVQGPQGQDLDPFHGQDWLDDPQVYPLLADGKQFNQELGNTLSVETLAFFGRKLLTTTGARVQFDAGTHWAHVDWLNTEMGDGTVPEYSAIYPATTQNIPIVAEHGSIYTNSALQEILRWELIDKYAGQPQARAALTTDRFTIVFNPDKSAYRPGETISLTASVTQNPSLEPFPAATIFAELEWVQPLPGSAPRDAPKKLPDTQLSQNAPGQFQGQLVAPDSEGYYRVRGTVMFPDAPELTLDEIIAVERMSL
ncbi:MAG: hypothetical protein HY741_26875 [Chloroflexi bacterium]|nr:hypothetical protein [Chloroflexota bacterium]